MSVKKERHILALSGGKDSAALAVYMREKYPEILMEYVFIDSGCELKETYDYIQRIRAMLNIDIVVIGGANNQDRRDFEWWLKEKNFYLPTPQKRWCTEVLKIKPYMKWLQKNFQGCRIWSYVGLRLDEKSDRKGLVDKSLLISPCYPFVEDGLVYEDIVSILESSGVGFPAYHKWRSRSGCYFCFYQTKMEWLGLYDNHKKLFEKAASMEKTDLNSGRRFTWCEGISLMELLSLRDEIEAAHKDVEQGKEKQPKLCSLLGPIYKDSDLDYRTLIRGGRAHAD